MNTQKALKFVPLISLGALLYLSCAIVFIQLVPNAYEKVPQFVAMCGTGTMVIAGNLITGCAVASLVLLFTKDGRAASGGTKLMLVCAMLLPVALLVFAFAMIFHEFSHGSIGH